jgi:hypothetical protein
MLPLLNCQFHHRVNFPNGVTGKVFAQVRPIFRRVPNFPKCLSNHSDNGRFIERTISDGYSMWPPQRSQAILRYVVSGTVRAVIIAASFAIRQSKPVGAGAASQPSILTGERSGLLTHIATTESVWLRVLMKS